MGKKWLIVLFLIIILGLGAWLIFTGQIWFDPSKPLFKDVMGYSDGNYIYSCSKSLRARLQEVPAPLGGPKNFQYVPVNKDEARLFCYSTAVIENEGKRKVLQKPEVLDLINKYQYKDVTIKALEFKYIQDKEFVNRLLPDFKDKEIGCIIVLETPGEKLVYLEDEKLEAYEQFDAKRFDQYLSQASQADRQLFWDNLH